MVLEIFTLSQLRSGDSGFVALDIPHNVNKLGREVFRKGQDHVHVPADFSFFGHVRNSCMRQGIHVAHIHYCVSPNTELHMDLSVVSSIHAFMEELGRITEPRSPVVLMLSSDKYSAPFLEFLRGSLPTQLRTITRNSVLFSNLSILQEFATLTL